MNRWLRTLITFIRAQFLKDIKPDEETSLNFRVWITDVDLSIMNNAAMLSITEMGRIDLMIRTGFLTHVRRNRLYVPLASISAQFRRPLKRFHLYRISDILTNKTLNYETTLSMLTMADEIRIVIVLKKTD